MAYMHFLPELQDFLNKENVIYTVRRFLYEDRSSIVYIPGVGGCRRDLIQENVSKKDLDIWSTESGFSSTEAWWSKIQVINKKYPKAKLYLYRVEKLR